MAADPYITSYSQTYSEFGLQQSKMWPRDTLCMTIAGANTAKTAIMKIEACFPDSVVGFIPDTSKADLHFVKYSLDLMRHRFLSVSRGATQDNLSLDKLLSFPIFAPDVDEQHRIGAILAGYDSLIENSQRRIRILDTIARALYSEWFEHFRVPGHKKIPRVASPLGEIPKGWEVRKVADFADFIRGFEPGSEAYNHESSPDRIKFLRVGDFSKRDSATFINAQLAEGRLITPTDIAITLDGTVGIVRMGLAGAYSTGIRKVVVKDKQRLGWSFAYHLLLSHSIQATVHAHAKGTTIKHAGGAVAALEFVSPPPIYIERFENATAPMLKQIIVLQEQIQNLRRTRDLLLPRLLSGQIELEIERGASL
jgi:type I restriction enzyme S subunit